MDVSNTPKRYKIPLSVLVVIYTPALDVLMLERADRPGFWQSVTGSCAVPGEPLTDTAIREVAEESSIPFFINARTDVFLNTYPAKHDEGQLEEALQRAAAYAGAGASGLFAPGLRDPELIEKLCERLPLPVNILVLPDTPPAKTMAQLGVARISHGAAPYRQMTAALKEAAQKAFDI
jgi:ADP-ribose pyrophosphatase YjhB (NUDIX family)